MNPVWRLRLIAIAGSLLAVQTGYAIASGDFLWPALFVLAAAGFLLVRLAPVPPVTVLVAVLMFGYIVGNRGFAQITPTRGIPLLPAETVLMIGGTLLLVQSALRRTLPFRRDLLNFALLAWMLVGCLRIGFDVRTSGFLALRDFALVYYAGFFFLGQALAADESSRRYFEKTMLFSCALLLPVLLLLEVFPDFFMTILTWRGEPLIFQKGDLAGTFVAVGSILFFLRFEAAGGWWRLGVSLACAGCVLALNNRASMLGLIVAAGWLALGGRWRFLTALGVSGAGGIVAILFWAAVRHVSWQETPVFDLYERVISIADPTGQHHYTGSETFNKGDNNRFRWVWWHAVLDETIETNPYVGMGFGADLAERFVREYYPESEEFSVRSPHNVVLTIFARMGALGLLAFLWVMAVVGIQTWRAIRLGPREAAPWCSAWAIFTSACLGVVLEGPMGAVVFWTTLGVAHAALERQRAELAAAADELEPAATAVEMPVEAP